MVTDGSCEEHLAAFNDPVQDGLIDVLTIEDGVTEQQTNTWGFGPMCR
jgi:hypothetical protein